METIKLTHQWARRVSRSNLFNGIKNYDDLETRIKRFGEHAIILDEKGNSETDAGTYYKAVGAAYEVFAEYFLRRFGSDTILDIHNVQDTSTNEYELGYDFIAASANGNEAHIQVKHRAYGSLKYDEVGTFLTRALVRNVPVGNRILFTNLSGDVFHFSFPAEFRNQMRVLDRIAQEALIDRSHNFWNSFSISLQESAKRPERKKLHPLWEHQQKIVDAALPIIVDGGRGKVICATGGGKTRTQFELVQKAFESGAKLQVVVAPTIALLLQHHQSFDDFGAFIENDLSVIHFRTGTDPIDVDEVDYNKTTNEKHFLDVFDKNRKTLIFTTFASERKLFDVFRSLNINVDVVLFDEFHNIVRQENDHIAHVNTLPARSILFFSASEKRGKLMNSFNEAIFGKKLCDITYKQLKEKGILVPKINVRFIHLDKTKLSALENDLKKSAERNEYDLHAACTEAAAALVSRHYVRKHNQRWSNIIVFSKRVAMCNDIVASKAMNDLILDDDDDGKYLLKAVSAVTPAHERNKLLADMRTSDDYIIFQHSVFKEGIDAPSINGVVLSRDMSVISTQQAIGRAVRVNTGDREALAQGRITIDNPDGWQKYSVSVFVIIHDGEDYGKRVKEFVLNVQESGIFSEDDWDFADLAEERHGIDRDELSSWAKEPNDVLGDKFEVVKEYVRHMKIEQEKAWKLEELNEELQGMSKKELIKIAKTDDDLNRRVLAKTILSQKISQL